MVEVIVMGPRRVAAFDPVRASSPLQVSVCAQCGLVQLYATEPAALWQAYQKIGR